VGVDGRVVWSGVQGIADIKTGAKITPETVFNVGSVSKQFTATAVLLLADQGKLTVGDRLSKYVMGFPSWADRVTLYELLHHTSGIFDYLDLLAKDGQDMEERTTQTQAVRAIAAQARLRFAPCTKWEYSNSNYLLLAEVVQDVSNESLAEFLQANIFAPLGLDMLVKPVGPVPRKASSYVRTGNTFYARHSLWEQVGATGVESTAGDLVRWGDNYRTGKIGGPDLLTAQLADPADTGADDGSPDRYGAGMYLSRDGVLSHLGDWEVSSLRSKLAPTGTRPLP
jgi:CubicO group peptidase (beta-lactamase class C family)